MELDDLVAINGLRGIVPAENAASPAYAVPTLIGRLLWHGDELDTRELAALGDREYASGDVTLNRAWIPPLYLTWD